MTSNPKPTSADLRALLDSGEFVLVERKKIEAMYAYAEREELETIKSPHREFFAGRRNGIGSVLAMLAAAPSPEGDAENIGQQEKGADR